MGALRFIMGKSYTIIDYVSFDELGYRFEGSSGMINWPVSRASRTVMLEFPVTEADVVYS